MSIASKCSCGYSVNGYCQENIKECINKCNPQLMEMMEEINNAINDNMLEKELDELPKITQSEFNLKAMKILTNIANSYSQSWHSRQLKEDEFPHESICDKCTGCGTFINGELESECFQDKMEGWCYHRYQDAEEFGIEVETELENIYKLIGVEIVPYN